MEVFQTWFCIVLDKKNHSKYICYTHRKNGMLNICLTDATDVWSTEVTEDTFKQSVGGSGGQRIALKSTVDYILNLRSACGQGGVSVVLHESCAEVCVSSAAGDLSVTLPRLEGPRAPEEVKELLFRMADSGPPSVGPVKPDQWRPAEGQQSAAPAVTMKKRLPGASLINPGTKRKRPATGVAFDEEEEEEKEEE